MKDIQAIKKILVEFPFFDGISRQTIRGSDNADSDGNTCSGSDSTHLPFFQGPQKVCLNLRRPVGYSVEKKGPGVSFLSSKDSIKRLLFASVLRFNQQHKCQSISSEVG